MHTCKHPTTTPLTAGNIDVFKGMQIKELDLAECRKLKGRSSCIDTVLPQAQENWNLELG